jgi:hypothetical protein
MRCLLIAVPLSIACGGAMAPPLPPPPPPSACDGGVPQSFTVIDTDTNGPALGGVKACIFQSDGGWGECTTTSSDGLWSFCAPANAPVAVSYEQAGYIPMVLAYMSGASGTSDYVGMRPDSLACGTWRSIGLTCPPVDKAFLWLRVHADGPELPPPPGIEGVTVTVAGQTSWYNRSEQLEQLGATTTTGNAFIPLDAATAVVVDVGLSRPSATCRSLRYGWPGTSPNTLQTVVRPGFRTFASATCE